MGHAHHGGGVTKPQQQTTMAPRGPILIIEDDRDTREPFSALLEWAGFTVASAASGCEGLALAASLHPWGVILDLGLPGRGGLEVLQELRGLPGGAAMRIIVLTGWCDAEHERLARAAGCDHFVSKPAEISRLIQLLDLGRAAVETPSHGRRDAA